MLIGDRDRAAVAAALQWGDAAYRTEARPLSPVAYRRAGDRLAVWSPEAGHPAHPAAEQAQRTIASVDYAEQKGHIDRLLSAVGEDVFVASASLVERDGGTLWTWAVWSNDVTETLLPEVDVVAFHAGDGGEGEGAILFVPWDEVLAEAGDHLTEEPGWGLTR